MESGISDWGVGVLRYCDIDLNEKGVEYVKWKTVV